MKSVISLIVYPCLLYSQLISPIDNDSLNTIHVLFEWEQLSNAVSYQIQIAENDSTGFQDPIADLIDSTLLIIMDEGFKWGTTYAWRIRSVNSMGDYGEWSVTRIFHVKLLPPEISSLDVLIYDSLSYENGITVMDQLGEGIIYAIDIQGNPVWFVHSNIVWSNGFSYLMQFSHFLPDGNFIGIAEGRENNLPGRAFEMGIDNTLIWEGPGDLELFGVHHDVFPMPNGNVLAITIQDTLLPIPDEIDVPEEYSYIDSVSWQGDRIVEWDKNGNEIWSWSVFDHFDTQDYNSNTFESMFVHQSPSNFFYEWTHSNSIWYDDLEKAIYLSVRHLSRITKIDYLSGSVVWNMGTFMPSGDVTVGNDLGLSGQHSVKLLDNSNLMMYDNGFESDSLASRGLEISVISSDSIPEAEVVWEYILPQELGSPIMSDCDRLPNGNSLITSSVPIVNYIVEVSPSNEIIWETVPGQGGSTFRAERIPGLYKHVFSILQPDFTEGDDGATLELVPGDVNLEYRIINEGWHNENYLYTLSDDLGWFSDSGSVEINSREETELFFSGNVPNEGVSNTLLFTVFPENAVQHVRVASLILEPSLSIGTSQFSRAFSVNPVFPNPFNPVTTIQFTLPMVETWHAVSLQIYDISGTLVETLMDEQLAPGQYTVKWNATEFSSGVYFLKLEAGNFSQVEKLMLIK